MEAKVYTKTFNEYLPKSQRLMNIDYNKFNKAFSDFTAHVNRAPDNYHSFCQMLYLNFFSRLPDLYAYAPSTLISRSTGKVFSNASDLFLFISMELAKVYPYYNAYLTSLDFTHPYLKQLYTHYYSCVSTYKKGLGSFALFLKDIYKLYPSSHPLHDVLIMYNFFFSCTDKNLEYRQNSCKINDCIRYIYDLDPSLATDKHRKKKIKLFQKIPKFLPYDSFHTSAPECTTNYSFNFCYENSLYHAYFKESELTYESAPNKYMTVPFLVDIKSCENIQLSDSAIRVLYNISGGSKKDLDMFAVLCAILSSNYYSNTTYTMPSRNISPLCLYTIFADSENLKYLMWLISVLYFPIVTFPFSKAKEITKTLHIMNLVNCNLSPSYSAIPTTPSLTESNIQIATIKKIIQRKPISRKLPDGQNITLLNHLPMLCFTHSQKELNYLNTTYKTKVFHFKNVIPDYFNQIEEANMLMAFLCIYGLHLLYTQNWHTSTLARKKAQDTSQTIVQRFLRDYTSSDENAYIYAKDLYDYYIEYCNLSNSGTPLTRILFVREVRKTCLCEYKKPRHSRSDNRYAFIGLKKDIEKSNEFEKKMNKEHTNITLENFSTELSEPLQIVNDYIQSLLHRLETPKPTTITVHLKNNI